MMKRINAEKHRAADTLARPALITVCFERIHRREE